MVVLVALLTVSVFLLVAVYLLGFRLGSGRQMEQLQDVGADAAQAERQLYDLTREAFIAMTDQAMGGERP